MAYPFFLTEYIWPFQSPRNQLWWFIWTADNIIFSPIFEDTFWYKSLLKYTLILSVKLVTMGFSGGSNDKESACNAGDQGSIPGSGREWQSTPVFLSGELHGQ